MGQLIRSSQHTNPGTRCSTAPWVRNMWLTLHFIALQKGSITSTAQLGPWSKAAQTCAFI